ncbi:MAG: MotA/TolQ/ExbB proton channel family protein [Candidatus Omnitrophica bacterium]|nr:MotA/TolQ/ExbB proton channel family protein [Candidatus Omnitrophota bacterium]
MEGIWGMSAWEFIKLGGPVMIPILLCSLFALGIIIEKLVYFSMIKIDVPQFKTKIFALIKANKIREAVQLCDASPSPVAKIFKAGILKFGAAHDEIKESMDDASSFEIPKMESRLGAVATIAHIAPLLGLLGTVTGMTSSFHTIQVRAASLNPVTPGDLAGGISEALLTTVAGLMVAIPTYVVYNYCVSRINRFVLEMERSATELINFMSHIAQAGAVEPAALES